MSGKRLERWAQLYKELNESPWLKDPALDLDGFVEALWLAARRSAAPNVAADPAESAQGDPQVGADDARDGRDDRQEPLSQHRMPPERGSQFRLRPPPVREPAVSSVGTSDSEAEARVRAVAPRALDDELGLGRALRPLRRRVASPLAQEIDEEATVLRIAETRSWYPVFRPYPERWLDLVVLVDQSVSMDLWRGTITAFIHLLERHGAFRSTIVLGLSTDHSQPWLRQTVDIVGQHRMGPASSDLVDPRGRRLFLLVSDCVAEGWGGQRITHLLSTLTVKNDVALLQVLPERLWWRTVLGRQPRVLLRADGLGAPRSGYGREPFGLSDVPERGVAIPVAALQPRSLARVARLVVGAPDVRPLGTVFLTLAEPVEPPIPPPTAPAQSIEARVRAFEAEASPGARNLARHLAVVPVTMPVARLVARMCRPPAGLAEMAEVFLSGLLLAEADSHGHPDQRRYTFLHGAREHLARTVTVAERQDTLVGVGRAMRQLLYLPTIPDDFKALVDFLCEADAPNAFCQDFAVLTAHTLELLGGADALIAALRLRRRFAPASDAADGADQAALAKEAAGSAQSPRGGPHALAARATVGDDVFAQSRGLLEEFLAADLVAAESADYAFLRTLLAEPLPAGAVSQAVPGEPPAGDPEVSSQPDYAQGLDLEETGSAESADETAEKFDFGSLPLPGSENTRARLQRAAAAAAQTLSSVERRYLAIADRSQPYRVALPDLYEPEAGTLRKHLNWASTAIETAESRLSQLFRQVRGWGSGNRLQEMFRGFSAARRMGDVKIVERLLAEAIQNLDTAEGALEALAKIPLQVAAHTSALIQILARHSSTCARLVGALVTGVRLAREADLGHDIQRLASALPPELLAGDPDGLKRLQPIWIADTNAAVLESQERLIASLRQLDGWISEVLDTDRRISSLEQILARGQVRKAALHQYLQPDVLQGDLEQLQLMLAQHRRRRRGVDVDDLQAFADSLQKTISLAVQFSTVVDQTHHDLEYLRAVLPDLSRRLTALSAQIRQAETGELRLEWDGDTTTLLDRFGQHVAALAASPVPGELAEAVARVKQARDLASAVEALELRLVEIASRRAQLAGLIRDPRLKRDATWVQAAVDLQGKTKAFGRANWPQDLNVSTLARDVEAILSRVQSFALNPDEPVLETQLDQLVDILVGVVDESRAWDERAAAIVGRLRQLTEASQAAANHVDSILGLLNQALGASPGERTLRDLRGEAQRLKRKLNPPIKDSVAALTSGVDSLQQQSVAACARHAADLRSTYTRTLQSIEEMISSLQRRAAFAYERQLPDFRQQLRSFQGRNVPARRTSTFIEAVDDIAALSALLAEVQGLWKEVKKVSERLQAAWARVEAQESQVRDSLRTLQGYAGSWPPATISFEQVEQQIQEARAIAERLSDSNYFSDYENHALHAINAFQSCERTLSAERMSADEQRLRSLRYEQLIKTWSRALETRIGLADIPPILREQAQARIGTTLERLEALRGGYLANTLRLTGRSVEDRLEEIWREAKSEIAIGRRPTIISLRTIEERDGTVRFYLTK